MKSWSEFNLLNKNQHFIFACFFFKEKLLTNVHTSAAPFPIQESNDAYKKLNLYFTVNFCIPYQCFLSGLEDNLTWTTALYTLVFLLANKSCRGKRTENFSLYFQMHSILPYLLLAIMGFPHSAQSDELEGMILHLAHI